MDHVGEPVSGGFACWVHVVLHCFRLEEDQACDETPSSTSEKSTLSTRWLRLRIRQFREIDPMFALMIIEPLCELLSPRLSID